MCRLISRELLLHGLLPVCCWHSIDGRMSCTSSSWYVKSIPHAPKESPATHDDHAFHLMVMVISSVDPSYLIAVSIL